MVDTVAREFAGGLGLLQQVFRKVDALAFDGFRNLLELSQQIQDAQHVLGREDFLVFQALQDHVFRAEFQEFARQVFLRVHIFLALLASDFVQRRLREIDVALLDDLGHLAVEKGQEQGADMRSVHVGIGHDDDLVVADLLDVELVLADTGADCGDQRANFVVVQDLVEAGLFNVQNLAAQRQNGLKFAIAALFGRAAGAVALDDVEFAKRRGSRSEQSANLPGRGGAVEGALAPRQVAGLAGGRAGAGRKQALFHNAPR